MVKDIVNIEVALAEFDRFTDAMSLDVDTAVMDEEDLATFDKTKRRLVIALCNGSLVINDHGKAVFAPQEPDSKFDGVITFNQRTGASLMASDGKKKNHNVKMTYAIMGEMTKQHPGVFAKLSGNDIKICEYIYALLMD